ncbi:MAG: YbaN family protein [Planctomycetota bacterium]
MAHESPNKSESDLAANGFAANEFLASDQDAEPAPKQATRLLALLYWFLAGLFFLLGMIGVVLPGLPTTPFLLLMCYFLVRVSPKLHAKAMSWPVVGGPLRDWHDQRGVRKHVKAYACSMVVLLVGGTLIWSTLPIMAKVLILLAALYGIFFVIRLPTAIE